MNHFLSKRYPNLILSLILILAAFLRFYGLTNQSMWVDELHTMIEADPSIPLSLMFDYLKCCDPHPPLYFIVERILFSLFGHTEGVARSLSAVCGLVSVWAMYLLGKELMDKKLGLIAALITSINYFNIEYSQEARCYIMVMLFSVLSFLYFIKLIKGLRYQHISLYVLFTLLTLYSHYYSIFIVTAQGLVALIFLIGVKENRKQFFRVFAISGVLIVAGYLPWVPFLIELSKIHSFWIGPIPANFAITYFFDYFGNYKLLKPLLILLIAYFLWQVLKQKKWSLGKIKESPLQLTFLVFFIAVAVTYIIPYVRSVLVVPMLIPRYTIVVLPAFILFISFAFVLINNMVVTIYDQVGQPIVASTYQFNGRVVQTILLTTFVLLTLTTHVFRNRYYSKNNIRKTQFREMTSFISDNPNRVYPIVEERTSWQHAYYLKQFNYTAPVLTGKKEAIVDSILNKRSPKYDLYGFWIVGAHGSEPHLNPGMRTQLDTAYTLINEQDFYDAWAQLFVRKNERLNNVTNYFRGLNGLNNGEDITIWRDSLQSQPIPMKVGKYAITFLLSGTMAGNIYPHVTIYLDNKKIGDFFTAQYYSEKTFSFEISTDRDITFILDFDNDIMIGEEDRNVLIKIVTIEEMQ